MLRAFVVVGLMGSLLGCDGASRGAPPEEQPLQNAPSKPLELDPRDQGFHFGPTFTVHRPPGSALIPLAEVGVADRRSMQAVVAYADVQGPAIGLWRFEMGGEKDTLQPSSSPVRLLAVRDGEAVDVEALNELRTQMGTGHAVVTHPQGLEKNTALDALDALHDAAQRVHDTDASAQQRVEALAQFVRGLDEDLLLSRSGLPKALSAMQVPTRVPESPDPKQRRVTLLRDGLQISMLRKSDGWVISAIDDAK